LFPRFVNKLIIVLISMVKLILPPAYIKWHNWLCHTCRCIFYIFNLFFIRKKFIAFN